MAEGDPIGLQITVQDFDGFLNKRRARAASYESAAREQALHDVENTVALSVWKSQQALESRPRALAISRLFVESASKSYDIDQGRYKAGVGTILSFCVRRMTWPQRRRNVWNPW